MTLLTESDRTTLVHVVRTMFPHRSFPSGPYERAADQVLDAAATDPRSLAQLCQGLHDLNSVRDRHFVDLDDGTALNLLRGIKDTPFFAAVHTVALVKLYDDHEVWDLLGYEGASFDQGGYIDRGFDDLDWLPEPQIEFEEGVA